MLSAHLDQWDTPLRDRADKKEGRGFKSFGVYDAIGTGGVIILVLLGRYGNRWMRRKKEGDRGLVPTFRSPTTRACLRTPCVQIIVLS